MNSQRIYLNYFEIIYHWMYIYNQFELKHGSDIQDYKRLMSNFQIVKRLAYELTKATPQNLEIRVSDIQKLFKSFPFADNKLRKEIYDQFVTELADKGHIDDDTYID